MNFSEITSLGGLVHAGGEFALPVVVAVKELDLTNERIVGVEICEDIREPEADLASEKGMLMPSLNTNFLV
jgi:hypothetical protein